MTRRNAAISFGVIALAILLLALTTVVVYRYGYLDNYVKRQFVAKMDEIGMVFDADVFRLSVAPLRLELKNATFTDKLTGEKLFFIRDADLGLTVQDLYAWQLSRDISIDTTNIDGAEIWVRFDENGNSNFDNLKFIEDEAGSRVNFTYSSLKFSLKNGLIHFGDVAHKINADAKNVALTFEPENYAVPDEQKRYKFDFTSTDSNFIYDESVVQPVDIRASGIVDKLGAEIADLKLTTPMGESTLSGTLTDWAALKYNLNIASTVDLTQTSNIFPVGTPLRGFGNFSGTVTGEGEKYKIVGEIKSDALAASNIRLKALQINATVDGDGSMYNANGKAIAELLTFEDFQIDFPQLVGNVRGTGTDFRWVGELQAAAAKTPAGTIAGLFISDAVAEYKDSQLDANLGNLRAQKFSSEDVELQNLLASNVKIDTDFGKTDITAPNLRASVVNAEGATLRGVNAGNVRVTNRGDRTDVKAGTLRAETVETENAKLRNLRASNLTATDTGARTDVKLGQVQADGVNASGATLGSLNASGVDVQIAGNETKIYSNNLQVAKVETDAAILGSVNVAGVRLTIRQGRIEATSGDFNAGNVALTKSAIDGGGNLENVKIYKPVFVLEPSGRYRASADLSLGGGVLGQIQLGAARANVVATNTAVQVNNFTAAILNGRASGNATVSTARNGASRIAANFDDLDVGNLAAVLSGRVVPVAGKATGTVDLSFPGTDVAAASGALRAEFNGETGSDANGRVPLSGALALNATRGLFSIERANLRTAASELNASGQFSLERDSNLQVNLASSDASELQRVLTASGLAPSVEDTLNSYNVELGGKLAFNGTVRGALTEPSVDGRASLDSIVANGRDLGSLSASINTTPTLLRITDGRLVERDGGGAQFALNAPLGDSNANNISLDATLDRVNVGNFVAALGQKGNALGDVQSDLSGRINVTGLPNAANGNADLRFGAGRISGQPFESIVARATFSGSNLNLENIDARFDAGRVTANGTFDFQTQAVNLQAQGNNIRLDRLAAFAGNASSLPQLTGTANITASATGTLKDFSSLQVNINGEGRDVTINGRQAGTLSLIGRTENKIFDLRLTTGIFGQPQVIAARVDLSNNRLPTTIETTLTNTDLTPLFAVLLPADTVKVRGRATGTFNASGNLADEDGYPSLAGLRGTARFTELTFQVEDVQLAATSPLLVQFSHNEVFFEKTQFTGPGTNVTFGGTAALSAAGRQNLSIDGRLNLRILNSFSPDIFLAGTAEASVRISGTFDQPRLLGTASVAGASFSTLVGDQRLTLSNLTGQVRFNSNQAQLESLTGNLGGGRVTVSGGAVLAGFVPTAFRFTVRGDNVTVPLPQNIRATADADLAINGTTRGTTRAQVVSGTINLRRAEYTQNIELADFINRRASGSLTEGGTGDGSTFGATTQLDLNVEGRDALVVRNNLADLVGSLALRVNGSADDPIISGRVTATRGTLNFRQDRYELTRAYIDVPPSRLSEVDPFLNIQAESDIRGYRVIVGLTGRLTAPQVVLRSDPSLPQADVVALITTGDLSGGETGTSTLAQSGVGTAASLLTNTLIGSTAQRATGKLFGLNRFEIDPQLSGVGRAGATISPRLTVGRQVNRDLLVTYSTNLTTGQNQVLAVQYRVSNRLYFVAQYEQGAGNTNLDTSNNNNFSFEIRFRKRF
ncbi:MAG: translocation/assembly module TamB domain-containing protein [Pyrinomonadaceae bacterium]